MVLQRERGLFERAVAAVNDHPRDVASSYDRDSDTMMVHFFGAPRSAVSISIDDLDDALYVRLDRAADEVVGLQIEGFMAQFMISHPDLADILSVARLRGIIRGEAVAAALAREQAPQVAAVTHFLERLIA
jgi:hypothetical protein